jgi:hypothetical protein
MHPVLTRIYLDEITIPQVYKIRFNIIFHPHLGLLNAQDARLKPFTHLSLTQSCYMCHLIPSIWWRVQIISLFNTQYFPVSGYVCCLHLNYENQSTSPILSPYQTYTELLPPMKMNGRFTLLNYVPFVRVFVQNIQAWWDTLFKCFPSSPFVITKHPKNYMNTRTAPPPTHTHTHTQTHTQSLPQNFKVPFDPCLKACFHVRYSSSERYSLIVWWILSASTCSQLNYRLKTENLFTTINIKYPESPSVVLSRQFDMPLFAPGLIWFKLNIATMCSKKDWNLSFSKFTFLLSVMIREFYCIVLHFSENILFLNSLSILHPVCFLAIIPINT